MKKSVILFSLLVFSLSISVKSSSKTGNLSKKNTKNITKADYRDGLSIKTAIKVSSVEEEYKYLSSKYPRAKFLGQALIYENNIPYDVLSLQMPDGNTVKFYFDVTEVFKMYEEKFGS